MIVDGKQIAEEVVAQIGSALLGRTLAVVLNEGDAPTRSFVKIKERVAAQLGVVVQKFAPADFAQALLCDAVVVQLPIDNADALLAQIPPSKDIDNNPAPPVAAAVEEILKRSNVTSGSAVVVGEGRLVGKPVAELLRAKGFVVQVVSLEQGSLQDIKNADVVVSGAGSPGLIKPDMLKSGVVLIDAGTSEQAGKLVGDCDPACAEVASVFTPTPGGVGPIAVAMLFKNFAELTKK